MTHDPREQVKMLQQILASDTKRIGFLFGAGTSIAFIPGGEKSKIPGVKEMTDAIIRNYGDKKIQIALKKIEEEFEKIKQPFYVEYILSAIIQKISVIGSDILCGLCKEELVKLKDDIEKKIIDLVSVHKYEKDFRKNLIHNDLALWIKQASRKNPIEIFTTNYDYLLEIALEQNEVPYFDGFIGSYKPFFYPAAVEDNSYCPKMTKLWKIHGSLGWIKENIDNRITKDHNSDSNILIYPSLLKYEHSQKLPYISLLDRLKMFIKDEDGVLLTCGYSFGDQHINDVILQGLSMTKSSHVIALMYDVFDENTDIYRICIREPRLSLLGQNKAIIGCKYGDWQIKEKPDDEEFEFIKSYFQLSAETRWEGKGTFLLPEFSNLTKFLKMFSGNLI